MPSSFHFATRLAGAIFSTNGDGLWWSRLNSAWIASATRFGQRVARLDGLADDAGEQLELAPVLDLVGAAGLGLRERLHDLARVVGVGGGAHRVLEQEVAHRHAVGVDAADAARRLLGDPARTLRAQRAADALLAELAALGAQVALCLHAVERGALAGLPGLIEHRVYGRVMTVCHGLLLGDLGTLGTSRCLGPIRPGFSALVGVPAGTRAQPFVRCGPALGSAAGQRRVSRG